jgi:hypothetical protein
MLSKRIWSQVFGHPLGCELATSWAASRHVTASNTPLRRSIYIYIYIYIYIRRPNGYIYRPLSVSLCRSAQNKSQTADLDIGAPVSEVWQTMLPGNVLKAGQCLKVFSQQCHTLVNTYVYIQAYIYYVYIWWIYIYIYDPYIFIYIYISIYFFTNIMYIYRPIYLFI